MNTCTSRAICLFFLAAHHAPAEPKLAAWAELAAKKHEAIFRLKSKEQGREMPPSEGFFISGDGLALCSLHVWMAETGPGSAQTATQKILPIPQILGVLPTHGLALVRFRHHPKTWIELADKNPPLGTTVAALRYDADQPAAYGRLLSFRSGATADFKRDIFRASATIGSWIDPVNGIIGLPVIDQNGKAVGVLSGIEVDLGQNVPMFVPIAAIRPLIEANRKRTEPLPLPLAGELIPFDPVIVDRRQSEIVNAFAKGDLVLAERRLKELKEAYPDSSHLAYIEADIARDQKDADGLFRAAEALRSKKNPNRCEQVRSLHYLATAKSHSGDRAAAIEVLTKSVEISPKDYPTDKTYLGMLLSESGRHREALTILKQAQAAAPDSIGLLTTLERVLGHLHQWDDQDVVTTEIHRLEGIFRRPVGGKFLPPSQ